MFVSNKVDESFKNIDGECDQIVEKAEKKFDKFVKDSDLEAEDYKMLFEVFCYQEIENHFDQQMDTMTKTPENK